jgi:hypothetical protein
MLIILKVLFNEFIRSNFIIIKKYDNFIIIVNLYNKRNIHNSIISITFFNYFIFIRSPHISSTISHIFAHFGHIIVKNKKKTRCVITKFFIVILFLFLLLSFFQSYLLIPAVIWPIIISKLLSSRRIVS